MVNSLNFHSPAILGIAGILIHFIWQGTLVGIALFIALELSKSAKAKVRYLLACLALAALFALPLLSGFSYFLNLPSSSNTSSSSPSIHQKVPATLVSSARPSSFSSSAPQAIESQPTPAKTTHFQTNFSWSDPLPYLVLLWFLGVMFLSIRQAGAWMVIRRLKTKGINLAPQTLQLNLQELIQKLNLKTPIRLFESSLVSVPIVIGYLRPAILLPASALTGLSPLQLEAILAHELSHIQRHDVLINHFQNLLETLFFYHPAVWWVSQQLRKEREFCCDDNAVTILGGNALNYVHALAKLEQLRQQPQFAMAATGSPLLERVRRLVGQPSPSAFSISGLLSFGTFITLLLSITLWLNPQLSQAQMPSNFQVFDRKGQEIAKEDAPHAFQMIRDEIIANIGAEGLKQNLKVYSTLDLEAQLAANEASRNAEMPPGAEMALLAIDPGIGGILAVVGQYLKEGETIMPFNRAIDIARPPAHSFSPIVYATAFEEAGLSQADIVVDEAITVKNAAGANYQPQNHDGLFNGPATIRQQVDISRSIPVVQMLELVSAEAVAKRAQSLGYQNLAYQSSLALGNFETSPLVHTSAMGAFANTGIYVSPHIISHIEDTKGTLIYKASPSRQRVWSEQTAYMMLDLLYGNVNDSIGFSNRAKIDGRWVGGKTGTSNIDSSLINGNHDETNGAKDIWFVGMTPGIVATVWIGNDDGSPLPKTMPAELSRENDSIGSSRQPIYIWKEFVENTLKNQEITTYPVPETIKFEKVDLQTGNKNVGVLIALPAETELN